MLKEFTTAGLIFISVSWTAVITLLVVSFAKALKKNELNDGD